MAKTEKDYINMQKGCYESNVPANNIVGNFEWHEEYPYETFLLFRNGDIRKPIFDDLFQDKIALDFACGPGRMIKRMRLLFKQVDGCDISARLIEEAKRRVGAGSNFYVTNGNDLGNTPLNHYDFVYCTISMQHIASYTIRSNILANIAKALKGGGRAVLQMAYNPHAPFAYEIPQSIIIGNQVELTARLRGNFASYFSDNFDATGTNGLHDVCIGVRDIEDIKKDLSKYFSNVAVWFSNVSNYYPNLNGKVHGQYWASDWIYLYGEKK